MGQRAIPSRISRHSYHPGEQTVKNKNLDYRVLGFKTFRELLRKGVADGPIAAKVVTHRPFLLLLV
jgi:hypothetical protein